MSTSMPSGGEAPVRRAVGYRPLLAAFGVMALVAGCAGGGGDGTTNSDVSDEPGSQIESPSTTTPDGSGAGDGEGTGGEGTTGSGGSTSGSGDGGASGGGTSSGSGTSP